MNDTWLKEIDLLCRWRCRPFNMTGRAFLFDLIPWGRWSAPTLQYVNRSLFTLPDVLKKALALPKLCTHAWEVAGIISFLYVKRRQWLHWRPGIRSCLRAVLSHFSIVPTLRIAKDHRILARPWDQILVNIGKAPPHLTWYLLPQCLCGVVPAYICILDHIWCYKPILKIALACHTLMKSCWNRSSFVD